MDFLTKLFSDYRPDEPGAVIDLDSVPSPAAAEPSPVEDVPLSEVAPVAEEMAAPAEPEPSVSPVVEVAPAEEPDLLLSEEEPVVLSPLERFLAELAEQDSILYPSASLLVEREGGRLPLCTSMRSALTILVRRDSTVENIEWGVVSMLAQHEGARAVKDTRSYELWRGCYYDILVAKLIFEDRTETRQFFFDASRSMFRC